MPATSNVTASGYQDIDGLLSGVKWTSGSLTYSFPASGSVYPPSYSPYNEPTTNFGALNATQQNAVLKVLDNAAAFSNLTFTQFVESKTNHGTLRYALSDVPSTAYAYYPSDDTNGVGGDVWLNHSSGYYDNPLVGTYAYATFLHETGHALGLKHGHEVDGGFPALPSNHDSLEYSVMTYRGYVGGPTTGYTVEQSSYPQTYMMDDIAALQFMYGANFNTNSGNTVYKWDPGTGEEFINGVGQGRPAGNHILMTVWDGNGLDTFDFSNYNTNLTVDLRPGEFTKTSAAQLSHLDAYAGDTHVARGNIANALLYNNDPRSLIENAIGGPGNDVIIGNQANNTLDGRIGSNYLDAGLGDDTAVLGFNLPNATLRYGANGLVILDGPGTSDQLRNFEHYRFSDGTVDQNDGQALVDDLFYLVNNDDVWAARLDPEQHYNGSGWKEGRDPNPFFSTSGYLGVYGDVKAAGLNPLTHYDTSGWKEGRDPAANFDTTLYLQHNPDVKAAGIDPLRHYLESGQYEGRPAYAAIGPAIAANDFDRDYYLLANPDVAAAGMDAFQHFQTFGWKEGRNPDAFFDTKGYLTAYADVRAAGVNPLDHFHQSGWREGRDPSAQFDTTDYLAHYGDVASAGLDPLMHYLTNGAYENRSTFSDGMFG